MRIHSAAGNFLSLLKAVDKDGENNNKSMTSPEIYASLSHLSEMILSVCHWLGRFDDRIVDFVLTIEFSSCRLPFIENVKYINLRQKIIKDLIQIRTFVRQLNIPDSTKTIKSKLILEVCFLFLEENFPMKRNTNSFSLCADQTIEIRKRIFDQTRSRFVTFLRSVFNSSSSSTTGQKRCGKRRRLFFLVDMTFVRLVLSEHRIHDDAWFHSRHLEYWNWSKTNSLRDSMRESATRAIYWLSSLFNRRTAELIETNFDENFWSISFCSGRWTNGNRFRCD